MAKTIKKAQAGLKASTKRVGPVDPNGAWTKVQEMNLPPRNVKTKASLTPNKELGATKMKKGGKVPKGMHRMPDGSLMKDSAHKAKEGKWIQKAINPKHKGYCTPMTKKTCTPKRKALAMTLKKMAKSRKGK
jgi:hypothetical protein